MKLIFDKDGKYRTGTNITYVSKADVSKKREFDINGENAENFVKAGLAHYPNYNTKKVVKEEVKIENEEQENVNEENSMDDERGRKRKKRIDND